MLRDVQDTGLETDGKILQQDAEAPALADKRVVLVRGLVGKKLVGLAAAGVAAVGLVANSFHNSTDTDRPENPKPQSAVARLLTDTRICFDYYLTGRIRPNAAEQRRYDVLDRATAAGTNKAQRPPNFDELAKQSRKRDLLAAQQIGSRGAVTGAEVYAGIAKDE